MKKKKNFMFWNKIRFIISGFCLKVWIGTLHMFSIWLYKLVCLNREQAPALWDVEELNILISLKNKVSSIYSKMIEYE